MEESGYMSDTTDHALARVTGLEPDRMLALAALVASLLFGLAGLVGAVGYLVAVSRQAR